MKKQQQIDYTLSASEIVSIVEQCLPEYEAPPSAPAFHGEGQCTAIRMMTHLVLLRQFRNILKRLVV